MIFQFTGIVVFTDIDAKYESIDDGKIEVEKTINNQIYFKINF